ncbi:hypothetical protein OCT63_17215 [Vibrio sp. RW]|uniref:LPD25 domain-containing protein n=1 Tax=Vibrio sp. RW TaxID=2998833 RepID=UPI0022CD8B4A|nr:LPD25 domain-containing protein [Vibrio sp. RW]MDA0145968.1 hypothetical protein [Vibrio sp. RW]
MIKPISVTVRYSESKSFEIDKTYSVAEFETIAYKVAASERLGGAKTDILIGFDNGHSFEDHLCVGRSDDHDKGIEKRIKELKKMLIAQQERLSSEEKMQYGFIENIDLSSIDNADNHNEFRAAVEEDEKRKIAEEKAAYARKEAARAKRRQEAEEFKKSLNIPEDAKGVIVAYFTSMSDHSDPYSDYYESQTDRVIVLAWSKHTRNLFPEMRKAAKNHEDTKHLADKETSTEHRENYSMGAGNYLTETDYIRFGLKIKKISFYTSNTRDEKACRVPFGEMAIPNYKPLGVEPVTEQQADVETTEQLQYAVKPVEQMQHSKKGHTIHVVNLEQRLDREGFGRVHGIAKCYNGHYSKYNRDDAIPGFHFKSIDDAKAFIAAIGGQFKEATITPPTPSLSKETQDNQPSQSDEQPKAHEKTSTMQAMMDRKEAQDATLKRWAEAALNVVFTNTETPEEPQELTGAALLKFTNLFLMDEVKMVDGVGVVRYRSAVFNVYFASNMSATVH